LNVCFSSAANHMLAFHGFNSLSAFHGFNSLSAQVLRLFVHKNEIIAVFCTIRISF